MEGDKVFLIYENSSDWESCPTVVGYATSEIEAKTLCDKLTSFYRIVEEFTQNLGDEVDNIDMSDLAFEDLVPTPKWASGLAATEISDEMRSERDAILAENEAIRDRNNMKIKERSRRIADFVSASVGGLDSSQEIKDYVRSKVNYYGSIKTYLTPYTYEEVKKLT